MAPHTIFRKLSAVGFAPAHVAEVGVYRLEASNVYDYLQQGVRCTLVEPSPEAVAHIRARLADRPQVTLHAVAIYDHHGTVELSRREASTFVSALTNSPAVVNDGYRPDARDTFVAEARRFDEVDDGTIDLLSVDTEGCEWLVIKHMVSRPAVISLETHGALYVHPELPRILDWMQAQAYVPWYKDKSDTVFVKKGAIPITPADRIKLRLMNRYLALRRLRKRIKKALRPAARRER